MLNTRKETDNLKLLQIASASLHFLLGNPTNAFIQFLNECSQAWLWNRAVQILISGRV